MTLGTTRSPRHKVIALGLGTLTLVFGWAAHGLYFYAGWVSGYREIDWSALQMWAMFGGMGCFLVSIVLCIVLTGYLLATKRPAWLVLIVAVVCLMPPVLLFVAGPGHVGRVKGRDAVLAEITPSRLLYECERLAQSPLTNQLVQMTTGDWEVSTGIADFVSALKEARAASPSIDRLRPSYLLVDQDSVAIELHGGFDHFGFVASESNGCWTLHWQEERRKPVLITKISSP